MDSILRDIDREQGKMWADVDNLHRHYEQMAGYVRQHLVQSTIEWAKLIVSHPQALLLVVETTPILDENGYVVAREYEPIRLTGLELVNGEVWDQLIHPTHSKAVQGTEYHGLTMAELGSMPRLTEFLPRNTAMLKHRHIIIFNADFARQAIQSVYTTPVLDNAFCLHNKVKEYYGEFYELSLEKVLSYQGIDKKRDELKDSRERIQMLAQVIRNLAAGITKQEPESKDTDSLDEHPF
jgi:DNA polymerase III epsilon subunit-like protein